MQFPKIAVFVALILVLVCVTAIKYALHRILQNRTITPLFREHFGYMTSILSCIWALVVMVIMLLMQFASWGPK